MRRKNKKNRKIFKNPLYFSIVRGYIYNTIGFGSSKHKAKSAAVKGGWLRYAFCGFSIILESVGRAILRGVSFVHDFQPGRLFFCTEIGSSGKELKKKPYHKGGKNAKPQQHRGW